LALAQTNLLQNKDAVAIFEKGLKLFPRDPRFYAEYGKVLLLPWASGEMPGAEAKAEQLLLKAVQLDGSLAMARFELGSLLAKSQRPADAVPHLEKAIQLEPENAQAHFILARAYRALGRTQDAEQQLLIFQNLQTSASERDPRKE
jgi:tetratricopeptide (TPR) repeat protein